MSGGTKLARNYAKNLGKTLFHLYDTRKERIFNPDSPRLEIQALTDFLCSNKIENSECGLPSESKEPGVYEWTLTKLRLFLNQAASEAGSTETPSGWTLRPGQ
jgi:hypothetical protein